MVSETGGLSACRFLAWTACRQTKVEDLSRGLGRMNGSQDEGAPCNQALQDIYLENSRHQGRPGPIGRARLCSSIVGTSGTLPESLPECRIRFIVFHQAIRVSAGCAGALDLPPRLVYLPVALARGIRGRRRASWWRGQ